MCVCMRVFVGLTDSDSVVKMCGLHFQTVAVFLCPLAMRVTILTFPTTLRLCHFMWGRGAGSWADSSGSPPPRPTTGCAPLSTIPSHSPPWCTSSWDLAAKPVGQTGGNPLGLPRGASILPEARSVWKRLLRLFPAACRSFRASVTAVLRRCPQFLLPYSPVKITVERGYHREAVKHKSQKWWWPHSTSAI